MFNNYFKLAFKVLLRRKFFTFVSLFGICLTLVVLMLATALLDHLFASHPPESKLDRILGVYGMHMEGPHSSTNMGAGYEFLSTYVKGRIEGAETISISQAPPSQVAGHNGSRKFNVWFRHVDGEFWRILDFEFVEGSPFTIDDENNRNFVAVINETTRRQYFGEGSAVGNTINADGQRFRVVGIVRDVPFNRLIPFSDIWVPNSTQKSTNYQHEFIGGWQGLVLARSREDFPKLKQEFEEILQTVELPDPENFDTLEVPLATRLEFLARNIFKIESEWPLVAGFSGFCLLFMLLPTVNLVNLNLSRIMERASEIGVRKSFGARQTTLIWQFVVENLILTILGGLLGFVLSAIVLELINGLGLVPYAQFALNLRIFFWGFVLIIVFGLVSGVYPAWRMSRLHPVDALRGSSR